MTTFEVLRTTTITEIVEVEADTLEEALEEVSENYEEFDFTFIDQDTNYEASLLEEAN